MKQVTQSYKNGDIKIEDVNEPLLKPGGIIVKTYYSLISLGTEGMKAKEGKLSYIGKARERPDQVKKVLQSIQQQGLFATYKKVMNRLDTLTPLGYSLSGCVNEVSSETVEFKIGDRVSCAGAGYANHAEINFIPRNLAVKIPENVTMEEAAFGTIGAIAMQGYRQSEMLVDETACVIGLGLLGQILIQILKSAGINVIGIDIDKEKCNLAKKSGILYTAQPSDESLMEYLSRLTGNNGADCVFLTASGSSNEPAELAVKMVRDRGKVVIIGKTKLNLEWKSYYEKELDLRFSRSYGPGRYDANYEEKGIDYPIGYVRWTEKRNIESFIQLIARGEVNVKILIDAIYPFVEATNIFNLLAKGKLTGVGILFKYDITLSESKKRNIFLIPDKINEQKFSCIRLGVIGAGNYASSMLLPNINRSSNVVMDTVANTTSLSALNSKKKFKFINATTDYHDILNNKSINTVLIATPHITHASLAIETLRSRKALFIEKPLAITKEELYSIKKTIAETGNKIIQVGFNRRFSKALELTVYPWKNRENIPLTAIYRIHSGRVDSKSWLSDKTQGTRFIGEGGHFIDALSYIFKSRPVKVYARSLNPVNNNSDDLDNISAIIEFSNGSIGTILYLTQGGLKVPKEYIEVYGEGKTVLMNNFKFIQYFLGSKTFKKHLNGIDKGQKQEINSFINSLIKNQPIAITVEEIIEITAATIAVNESLLSGKVIDLTTFLD